MKSISVGRMPPSGAFSQVHASMYYLLERRVLGGN